MLYEKYHPWYKRTVKLTPILALLLSAHNYVVSFCNSDNKKSPIHRKAKMKLVITISAAFMLTACSSSSGVVKIGPDTFTISTSASPGKGGVPAAKRIAYQEAGEECARRSGMEVFTMSEKTSSPTWTEGMANMELNFRCLRPNDPEFQRQLMQSSPDKIIENRQR
jgi:hypothetical protein